MGTEATVRSGKDGGEWRGCKLDGNRGFGRDQWRLGNDGAWDTLFFDKKTVEEALGSEQGHSDQEKETGTIQGNMELGKLSVARGS